MGAKEGTFKFRVGTEELEEWKAEAEKSKQSVAEWIRSICTMAIAGMIVPAETVVREEGISVAELDIPAIEQQEGGHEYNRRCPCNECAKVRKEKYRNLAMAGAQGPQVNYGGKTWNQVEQKPCVKHGVLICKKCGNG